VDPGLNFGRLKVPKLAKHCIKQKKTTAIGGQMPPLPSPLDPPLLTASTITAVSLYIIYKLNLHHAVQKQLFIFNVVLFY